MFGKILRGLAVLVLALAVALAGALLYRAWRQHENALALAIHGPNGIEESSYVRLGGIDQWIQIRGEDRRNPVLLFVHGGPGSSVTFLSSQLRSWESTFTVVMWDQRDAGRTFIRNGAVRDMSLPRVAQDGIELAQFLCRHLHKAKIVVLGHSWGSMVGLRMVHDRPDLFSAYVGTGQVVSIAEKEPLIYARTMAKLEAAHDQAGVRKLKAAGPLPYRSVDELMVERNLSAHYDIASERDLYSTMTPVALFAPGWSLLDIYEVMQASKSAEAATFDPDRTYDAHDLGPRFEVPFFIFNGADDEIAPTDLAKSYFDWVKAPQKQFVVLQCCGHSAVLTEPELFLRELDARVRPVAMASETSPQAPGAR